MITSDARYLDALATAYLSAPEDSDEENQIDFLLNNVCKRLGVDRRELVRRIGEGEMASEQLATRDPREQYLGRLLQVAVEAIRLVHGSQLGDHYSHEPCRECGLGGEGDLRDALTKALGVGYTGLLWGKDMNADWPRLREALERARE